MRANNLLAVTDSELPDGFPAWVARMVSVTYESETMPSQNDINMVAAYLEHAYNANMLYTTVSLKGISWTDTNARFAIQITLANNRDKGISNG